MAFNLKIGFQRKGAKFKISWRFFATFAALRLCAGNFYFDLSSYPKLINKCFITNTNGRKQLLIS